jgi:hypothetical protein
MEELKQIVSFLKGRALPGAIASAVEWKDEPYLRFAAEWQDWSFNMPGSATLFLGYWYEENGDLVPDPNLTVDLQGDEVNRITFQNRFGLMTGDVDRAYAKEFVRLIWSRHFSRRVAVADLQVSA